jgi:SAM-dependent methyltransferase
VLCAQIAYASARFAVPLDIYTVTAEEMHRLPLRNLDVVLFNSSLHHCDDPVAALRSAFTLLRGHGRVVVAHEPHLRFYRTRRQYQRQLADRPLQSGHYGGNEHIYYHHEYLRMLAQAGFRQVSSSLDVRNLRPRLAIEDLVQRKVRGQPVYSAEALLLRLGWLVLLARLLRLPLLGALVERALKALSLAAISYQGVKPA